MSRLFFGLSLSSKVRREIAKVQGSSALTDRRKSLRLIPEENMHVTLFFLGDVAATILPAVESAVRGIGSSVKSFTLTFDTFGCFPTAQRPRILWVGCREIPVELLSLVEIIHCTMADLGFSAETRPFQPHVTIARARRGLQPLSENVTLAPVQQRVDSIVLFESKRTGDRMEYIQREVVEFAGSYSSS